MTWFKVDDGFYDHPKFMDIPNAAIGLWAKCGAWCGRHLTDGEIPASQVKRLKGTKSQIDALLSARIWVQTESENGAKVYRFHDWNEYQPTREEKLKERQDAAERQRKSRARKSDEQRKRENVTRDSHSAVTRDSHECHANLSQRPDPTRPDPSRPETSNDVSHTPKPPQGAASAPGGFDEFWASYPRKVGKQKAKAKFAAAAKRAGDTAAIIAGARRLANDPNLPEQRFIPHPTTWLERDGWEDEPLPARNAPQRPTHTFGTRPEDWLPKNRPPTSEYVEAEVIEFKEIDR